VKPFSAFAAPGDWFRGNCHTHTTLSDGSEAPAATAALYRKKGYDFLVLTDHHNACEDVKAFSAKDFLVIRGVEMHPPAQSGGFAHHFIALGVKDKPPKRFLKTAASAIRWGKKQGALVFYCHPYWTGHGRAHLEEGSEALGVEVYNTTCDVHRGLGYSEVHWDHVLSDGWRWRALAVDDTHNYRADGFGGWIMVKAGQLTPRSILSAIKKGWFYATQGPEIHDLSMSDGAIELKCSPVEEVVWHANGPCGSRAIAEAGKAIEHARFEPKNPQATYLRLMIRDAKGRKAWSNPIWRNSKTGRWEE